MFEYITKILSEKSPIMDGKLITPVSLHFLEVNDEAVKLDWKEVKFFHHYVAKLVLLCNRARPDVQTAVDFLSTRVQSPDVDDYKNLACTMR